MPVRTFAQGDLWVSYPATLDVRDGTRVRNRSIAPEGVDTGLIEEVLGDGGFELVTQLMVRPNRARAALPIGDGDLSEKLDLEVKLRADEQAVVLMDRGGLLSWQVPQRRDRALGDGRASATFEVEPRPPGGGHADRGLVDDVRAFVLRFSAPIITGAAIELLEAGVDEGLVHVTSTDPKSWVRVESLSEVRLPAGGAPRILLFVHGTFSSTVGGFGSLTTDAGTEFLERAIESYDAVIGFDHRTLSVDPLANASALLKHLSVPRADGAVVDVISHSRGGLVVRSLVERLLPTANWSGSINRIVFVGVPNAGTNFAEPVRWSKLVDVYTNLLLASTPLGNDVLAKAIASCAIGNVGTLVKYLAAYATEGNGVPGLAAMQPDGEFIVDLNRAQLGQPEPGQPWFVIGSDFHAAEGQSKLRVIEGIVDDLLDEPNDLVVDTKSMAAIDTTSGDHVRHALDFGTNSSVYHTNYFAQRDVAEAIQSWLFPTAAPARDREFGLDLDGAVGIRVDGGGAGAPAPPPAPAPARRTKAHVLAEMPGDLVVDQPATVRVLLARKRIKVSAGAVSGDATIEVDDDEVLTVEVVPKRNVTVQGRRTARFRLPLDDGLSELPFVVKPSSTGPVEVRIIVRRSPTDIVATVTLKADAHELDGAARNQAVVRAQVETAAATSVDLKDAVWLEISELERPGYVQFRYELRLPGEADSLKYTSRRLHDRVTYVANLFRGIEDEWTQNGDRPKRFTSYLQEQGANLFEQLFPLKLQEKLWEKRDQLKGILLLADEPYFPWELVHLKQPGKVLQQKQRFLGQYGLIRWQFLPFPAKPELRRRRGRVYSLCPNYVDPALVLEENQAEAAYLKRKLGATAVPATPPEVRELLRNRQVDILHFSGHGQASPGDVSDARILLGGRIAGNKFKREYLSANTVEQRARLTGQDGTGPLVVLNACQVGISGVELSSLGGFARAFLEAGAQAFVSCLWSVKEQPSRIFVETLYNRLVEGDSISEAAVRARTAAHSPDDPATWLGFVIYARPDAKFVRG